MSKALKYADLISKSDDDVKAEDKKFAVKRAKQQVDADILETEIALDGAQIELNAAESANPYIPGNLIAKQIDVEGYEDGLKRLKALKALRF